jgi:Cys-rich protein (TIGR01571 family)
MPVPVEAEAQARHVADLPGGYEVTATKVQPTARAAHMLVVQNSELLPYPGEGRWHHDIFDRMCDFGGDCWMAWLCTIFPLAQVAEKHKKLGVKSYGYSGIAMLCAVFLVVHVILTLATKGGAGVSFHALAVVICFQLRAMTRKILGIEGSCFDDCLLSTCCTPCTVIQMVDTLWENPKAVPGCSIGSAVAEVV